MKALSLRQPIPWALFTGGCDTITWSRPVLQGYRGPLIVHASTHLAGDLAEFDRVRQLATTQHDVMGPEGSVAGSAGGFVGVVVIDSSHHSDSCNGICSEWGSGSGWHSRIAAAHPFPKKIPGRGKPGLFDPAPRVLRLVGA